MTHAPGEDAPATVERGVRLGVDVGTVRIGVAATDPDGLIATPVETVPRAAAPAATVPRAAAPVATQQRPTADPGRRPVAAPGGTPPADVARIAELAAERGARVVYVGLPRHLSGSEGAASAAVRTYCVALADAVAPVAVRLVDERLSTVSAHGALRASGRPGRRHRTVVDQAAAVVILQSAVDAERVTGRRSGELVEGTRPRPDPAGALDGEDDDVAGGQAG